MAAWLGLAEIPENLQGKRELQKPRDRDMDLKKTVWYALAACVFEECIWKALQSAAQYGKVLKFGGHPLTDP